jgi:hypothetical protein
MVDIFYVFIWYCAKRQVVQITKMSTQNYIIIGTHKHLFFQFIMKKTINNLPFNLLHTLQSVESRLSQVFFISAVLNSPAQTMENKSKVWSTNFCIININCRKYERSKGDSACEIYDLHFLTIIRQCWYTGWLGSSSMLTWETPSLLFFVVVLSSGFIIAAWHSGKCSFYDVGQINWGLGFIFSWN